MRGPVWDITRNGEFIGTMQVCVWGGVYETTISLTDMRFSERLFSDIANRVIPMYGPEFSCTVRPET